MQRKSDKTIPRYFDYFFNIVHIIQIDRAYIISHRFFNSKIYQIRGPVASLLAATLYQGNSDRNLKLWNIISTGRYILHIAGAAGMLLHINGKFIMRKLKSSL